MPAFSLPSTPPRLTARLHGRTERSPTSRRRILRLHLNAFRGEPAISEFDWHFTSTHSSSSVFAPTNGSGLHLDIIEASPWPWVAHPVSGRIPATSRAPCSDSLSLWLRKLPCLTVPLRFTRRLILQ